ncbi:MAG: LptF/LptG family permease [Mesorhizobium sp.]
MNLIERYIFGRAAKLTLITLFATTLVVLITQILVRVNLLTTSGQSLATVGWLALMLIPSMVVVTLPLALLIGALQVLSQMNSDSELAVLEGTGNSPARNSRPIIVLGLIASIFGLGVTNFVEPWSNRELRNIVAEAGADLVRIAVQSGSFKMIEPNLFIQISEERAGGGFGGLFIADLRDKQTELLYYAKEANIVQQDDQTLLVMADGEIQRRNPKDGNISIIRFASYAVDFNQFGAAGKSVTYFPKERSTAYLLSPDPKDHFTVKRPDIRRSELHRRFSEWLYPLAFALIAAYFAGAARSNRQEQVWTLTAAAVVALTIRGGGFFLNNVSGTSTVLAALTYLLPISTIALFGSLVLSGRYLRVSQRNADRLSATFTAMERRWSSLRLRGRGPHVSGAGGQT